MTDRYVSIDIPPLQRSTPDFGPVNDVWDVIDQHNRVVRCVMKTVIGCVSALTVVNLIVLWCIA